ncbi:MAG: DUF402 domain-containing protein [Dehalococcoidia bacterium]|nr:DUF402 domain-containing protein [Dehalococcoidia bacterium]
MPPYSSTSTAPMVRTWIRPGTRWVGYRGEGVLMYPFTMLFFTDDRWYNVMHQHQPTGERGQLTYVNLRSSTMFDGDTIRWVDLDLDMLRYDTRCRGARRGRIHRAR